MSLKNLIYIYFYPFHLLLHHLYIDLCHLNFSFHEHENSFMIDYYGAFVAWCGVILGILLYGIPKLRKLELKLLAILAVLCILPSDQCFNQFNKFWIYKIGSSPLMYVPNVFVIQFLLWHKEGFFRKYQPMLITTVIFGCLFLGLGHYFRFIW